MVWLQFIHQLITKGWATPLPQPNCLTSTGLSQAQHTAAFFFFFFGQLFPKQGEPNHGDMRSGSPQLTSSCSKGMGRGGQGFQEDQSLRQVDVPQESQASKLPGARSVTFQLHIPALT